MGLQPRRDAQVVVDSLRSRDSLEDPVSCDLPHLEEEDEKRHAVERGDHVKHEQQQRASVQGKVRELAFDQ